MAGHHEPPRGLFSRALSSNCLSDTCANMRHESVGLEIGFMKRHVRDFRQESLRTYLATKPPPLLGKTLKGFEIQRKSNMVVDKIC